MKLESIDFNNNNNQPQKDSKIINKTKDIDFLL